MVACHEEPSVAALKKWRAQLHNAGGEGLSKVRAAFTRIDNKRQGRLDKRDFTQACSIAGVFLTSQEQTTLFRAFPADGGCEPRSGTPTYVDLFALFAAVCGDLHPAGVDACETAWASCAGRDAVPLDQVVAAFDATNHPRVITHEITAEHAQMQLYHALAELMAVQGEEMVSKTIFLRYASELAACTPPGKPRFFTDVMGCFGGQQHEAVPAERISQLVLFLVDKLRQFTSGRVDALRFTVKKFFLMQDDGAKGGLTYAEFGHFLTSLGMVLPQVEKRGLFEHLAHLGAQATGEWVMYDELCRVCDELNAGTSETRYVSGEPPQSLVDKIRTHLLAKHPRGLQSLPLAFRHIDRENTRWVVHNDFNSGLRQCGLRLTKEDVTRLLAFYDPSSTDKVHYDRFIAHIRGAIGDERLGYIERGWAKVCAADGGGTEQVAATTLQRVFEPSMHPKVANNHQTPQAKIADLLDFAQEGDVVTRAQFLEYFLDDSSSISEDCYFERYMVTAFAL